MCDTKRTDKGGRIPGFIQESKVSKGFIPSEAMFLFKNSFSVILSAPWIVLSSVTEK